MNTTELSLREEQGTEAGPPGSPPGSPPVDDLDSLGCLDAYRHEYRAREDEDGGGVSEEIPRLIFDSKEALSAVIMMFVALHEHHPRQRTPGWLKGKLHSIGGSEIASLMGLNPYCSFDSLIARKAGLESSGGGNIACWWGTMFESAIEKYVAIDCGTTLFGTDISVPAPATSLLHGKHKNSPDGYAAIEVFLNDDDDWQLLTTDARVRDAAEGRPVVPMNVLLEFKCPYRRQPKGAAPKHYQPQMWSGAALSPIVHKALFVDAVFRKCSLESLGPGEGYDRGFHRERNNPMWTTPVAWGLTGIYAPELGHYERRAETKAETKAETGAETGAETETEAETGAADTAGAEEVSFGSVDAGYEAWLLHYKELGAPYESRAEAKKAGREFRPDLIDLGDCSPATFEAAMQHLDAGRFRSTHVGPCFSDGRGAPLQSAREIGAAIDRLSAESPPNYFLLGVIPWKMLEVDYVFVDRRPDFLNEIAPLVTECLDTAERIRNSPDPSREYSAYIHEKYKDTDKFKSSVSVNEVQSLFDFVAS